jgi:polyhydroxyalkanoate synthesis repressor PhaR
VSDPVVIKRYQNRRLYDTEASAYVNLDQLAALVRDGRRIQVIDAKTGEDLTRRFMTQILIESQGMLPLEILQQLACASDRAFRDFLNWYLSSAMAVYQQVQDTWQKPLRDLAAPRGQVGMPPLWDPGEVASVLRERWESLAKVGRPASEASPPDETPPQPNAAPEPEDIERLTSRLEELEKKLSRLESDDSAD